MLLNDLGNYLCHIQYSDNSYITKNFTIENELYYLLHNNLKKCAFRGKFDEYDGYFKKEKSYWNNKLNRGQFNNDDINNYKIYYDEIKLFLIMIRSSPIFINKDFIKIEKQLITMCDKANDF